MDTQERKGTESLEFASDSFLKESIRKLIIENEYLKKAVSEKNSLIILGSAGWGIILALTISLLFNYLEAAL